MSVGSLYPYYTATAIICSHFTTIHLSFSVFDIVPGLVSRPCKRSWTTPIDPLEPPQTLRPLHTAILSEL